ncbi:MAG: ATP-binding protein, partial [Verrucomicrobiota bacterium]
KRVELSTHFAADTPIWFLGDGDRLKQILLNLLNNALKFTENGTIKVHLGARALDEAGDGDSAHAQRWRLDFSVTDSGVGIEPDVLETLFQPFQQGKNAVSRKNGGTGLGLTICRQLCHLMGGDIWAESTPGEGATFSFYLVCDPDTKSLSSGQGNQGTLAGFENLAQRFPLRIMLVDDAPINRHLMKSVLQRLGYAPVICENGAEAVAAAEQQDFDLIFMDIRMPEMSGIEASRAIREGIGQRPPEERHLPFIAALTADAMKQDIDSCFEAGMNCYLTKPFMPEDAERFIKHNWERITQQVMAPEPMDWMV